MNKNNNIHIKTVNSHCVEVIERVPYGVGIEVTVFSYDTPVLKVDADNGIHRLWSGWSSTTQRDINKCVNIGMNKKMWDNMKVE